ncbi:right-handed parallel beta-helix repeat-containing protein [Cerasicoccus arenae]
MIFTRIHFLSHLCCIGWALSSSAQTVELWRTDQLLESFDSIQKAVDVALAGDRIQLREGVYHESVYIDGKHADPANPIVLEGTPGERVVLDDADPGLQISENGRWQWDEGDDAWIATVPWSGRDSRSLLSWASYDDGRLIASHHNEEKFKEGARGDALWRTGEHVHLRLLDKVDPNTLSLNIGRSEAIIYFNDSSGWVIRNLTLRHAGFAGVYLNGKGVSDIELEHLTIEDSFRGISSEDYGAGGPSSRIQISDCRILNRWDFSWAWKEGYRDAESPSSDEAAPVRGSGIHLRARDSKILRCEVAGQWDGMQLQGTNLTIQRNLIHHIKDDMIELESNNSKNVRVFENIGFNLFSGLSVVANRGGPVYIYRNFIQTNMLSRMYDDVWRYGYPLKFGNDWGPGAEHIYIYQNTFDSLGRSMFVARRSNPQKWRNIEWVNNIFSRGDDGPVGIEGMGAPDQGLHWEGNLFTKKEEMDRLRAYDAAYSTAGILGQPGFVSPNRYPPDPSIREDSDVVGAGSLRAIESGWPDSIESDSTTAPEIGAIPFGMAVFKAGTSQPPFLPWNECDEASTAAP